ncbi:hypothetical protein HGRIS_000019 [Hohenbuehelia grisea]|uniref:F-box domain-containing protein n=1 Tax=Hohenbuehelia grisea TaxID=104357 RepID=A0ABR3JQF4_9AGAR
MDVALPPEIRDYIASFIQNTAELLALAMTCRNWKSTIIPQHLEYRVIRCSMFSGVWQHLAENPRLAKNVTQLFVTLRRGQYPVPHLLPSTLYKQLPIRRTMEAAFYQESIIACCYALKVMKNLHLIQWTALPEESYTNGTSFEGDIWTAVQQLPDLESLSFNFQCALDTRRGIYNQPDCSLWSVSNLRRISLRHLPFPQGVHLLVGLRSLLLHSPRLESLIIYFNGQDIVFPAITLPNLTSFKFVLNIEYFSPPETPSTALTRFLEVNPSLERVEWVGVFPAALEDLSLPSLRHIHGDDHKNGLHNVLNTVTEAPRAIETISQLRLNGQILETFGNIDGEALRRIDLTWFHSTEQIIQLAQLCPRLTWLSVPAVDYLRDYNNASSQPIVRLPVKLCQRHALRIVLGYDAILQAPSAESITKSGRTRTNFPAPGFHSGAFIRAPVPTHSSNSGPGEYRLPSPGARPSSASGIISKRQTSFYSPPESAERAASPGFPTPSHQAYSPSATEILSTGLSETSASSPLKEYRNYQAWIQSARAHTEEVKKLGSSFPIVWVLVEGHNIPPTALGGLYVGKAGRHLERGAAIPYNGQEVPVSVYEVLVPAFNVFRYTLSETPIAGQLAHMTLGTEQVKERHNELKATIFVEDSRTYKRLMEFKATLLVEEYDRTHELKTFKATISTENHRTLELSRDFFASFQIEDTKAFRIASNFGASVNIYGALRSSQFTATISVDDQYSLRQLSEVKTVILVDDSQSMAGKRWVDARDALAGVVDSVSQYGQEGVDIHFLNEERFGMALKEGYVVNELFDSVRPQGVSLSKASFMTCNIYVIKLQVKHPLVKG